MRRIVMECKNCGADMPVPPPQVVVRDRVVEVEHGEAWMYVRIAAVIGFVCVVLIAGVTGSSIADSWVKHKAISDPTVKIKLTEYDHNGKVVLEANR